MTSPAQMMKDLGIDASVGVEARNARLIKQPLVDFHYRDFQEAQRSQNTIGQGVLTGIKAHAVENGIEYRYGAKLHMFNL